MLNKWYDKGNLLSYKMFFNMLIGNRGGGKTYSFKRWCVDDFLKTGKQFVWVRRYGTEIVELRKTFFDDIKELYPNLEFKLIGSQKSGKILINGVVAGYYVSLTTSAILKSSAFPLVDKIVFDEFLIIGKTYHYLSDEVVMLLELIETIFRDRENNPNAVKPRGVYLLGNNITIANPYFLYFGVKPFKQRFYIDKKKGLLVEMFTNDVFVESKKQSNIGKLTAGTTYAEYSIENKSYLDNDRFIAKKPAKCDFMCAIDFKNKTYGFWLDVKNGNCYVNNQFDPYTYNRYSLTRDDHSINTFLIKNVNNSYLRNIVWLFRAGCMYFDNQQIKAQVYELLSYFVR